MSIPSDWEEEYQFNELVAGGLPNVLARAVTNLLTLYAMEAYQGCDDQSILHWRVQYKKDAYRLKYLLVPYCGVLPEHWISTVKEVEATYGRSV